MDKKVGEKDLRNMIKKNDGRDFVFLLFTLRPHNPGSVEKIRGRVSRIGGTYCTFGEKFSQNISFRSHYLQPIPSYKVGPF